MNDSYAWNYHQQITTNEYRNTQSSTNSRHEVDADCHPIKISPQPHFGNTILPCVITRRRSFHTCFPERIAPSIYGHIPKAGREQEICGLFLCDI